MSLVSNDHTTEPALGSIEDGEGEYIGEDLAECGYCGQPITGDSNGWRHIDADAEGRY